MTTPCKLKRWGGNPPDWLSLDMLGKIEQICEMVAKKNDINVTSLFMETKGVRRVSDSRHLAMVAVRDILSLSLVDTGIIFRRDHTSVMHAIKCVRNKRIVDAEKQNRKPKI